MHSHGKYLIRGQRLFRIKISTEPDRIFNEAETGPHTTYYFPVTQLVKYPILLNMLFIKKLHRKWYLITWLSKSKFREKLSGSRTGCERFRVPKFVIAIDEETNLGMVPGPGIRTGS